MWDHSPPCMHISPLKTSILTWQQLPELLLCSVHYSMWWRGVKTSSTLPGCFQDITPWQGARKYLQKKVLENVSVYIGGKNSCRRMASTAGDLTVCTDVTAPHTAQVTLPGGLCCFIFTHIHSLLLSFPLLDLRLGWFRLLRQMLEPCFKGCQRIWWDDFCNHFSFVLNLCPCCFSLCLITELLHQASGPWGCGQPGWRMYHALLPWSPPPAKAGRADSLHLGPWSTPKSVSKLRVHKIPLQQWKSLKCSPEWAGFTCKAWDVRDLWKAWHTPTRRQGFTKAFTSPSEKGHC